MGEKPSAESVRVPWQPDFIFSEQRSGWAVARPRDHNFPRIGDFRKYWWCSVFPTSVNRDSLPFRRDFTTDV